jgi:cytochrome oxidase assembly protein ShyY1
MKRLPFWPTLVVVIAAAVMVALGVWQLRRATRRTRSSPAMPQHLAAADRLACDPRRDGSLLYRRSTAFCLEPTTWSARAGRSRAGAAGWRHVVLCRTGAEGPGVAIDMGWSKTPANPTGWRGGSVTGTIDADRDNLIMLVAEQPAPGLEPSLRPTPADIPNNHRAYAVQWFAFASIALLIYALALRRRG